MRPGQSNKRVRGRSRRGPSPLSRSYESNGPDVKIRGTASHVAEKYMQLARDAQSAGDHVAAENYYQHAEHYFRIIAAAQQAQSQQQNPNDQQQQRPRYNGNDDSDADAGPNGGQPRTEAQRSDPNRGEANRGEANRGEGPQPSYRPQANGEPQPSIDQSGDQPEERAQKAGAAESAASRQPAEPKPEQSAANGEDAPAAQSNGTAAPKRRRRRATPPAAAPEVAAETSAGEGPASDAGEPDAAAGARSKSADGGKASDKLATAEES